MWGDAVRTRCLEQVDPVETEEEAVIAGAAGRRREEGVIANGQAASFQSDKSAPKLDSGAGGAPSGMCRKSLNCSL